MKLAFVGLGRMGSAIARNLLRAGHEVTVYNRSREKAEALIADGAKVAVSPAAAAKDCEAAFSMLADDHAVSNLVLGSDGLVNGLAAGAAHLSISTISVSMAKQLANEHEKRGQVYLSSPVFGRPDSADSKKLVVVVAGEAAAVAKYRHLLDAIGRETYLAGDQPWRANLIKLCGNFMIGSMMESFAETFATIRKAGMDHHLFLDIMSELFGSPIYKNYGTIIADEKFQPAGFALKLGLKDVRLTMEAALDLGSPMPFASVLRDHFLSAVANGQEQMDWSSVAQVAARASGLEVKQKQTS